MTRVTHINEARPRSSPLTQVDLEDSPGDVVACTSATTNGTGFSVAEQ
jgi:hypothetical protein